MDSLLDSSLQKQQKSNSNKKQIPDVTSPRLCENPFCCPVPDCTRGHVVDHDCGHVKELKVCRYGTSCTDSLCQFYHPRPKFKMNCPVWNICLSVYCRGSHPHKYRPPVCSRGVNCANLLCRRLHPPNNRHRFDSHCWNVFGSVPFLIEEFLTFAECRAMSKVCKFFNRGFSTNINRIKKTIKLQGKYIKFHCRGKYASGMQVWIPFELLSVFVKWSQVETTLSGSTNSQFFVEPKAFTNMSALSKSLYSNPPENEWILQTKTYRVIELARSKGVCLEWQTRDYFQDTRSVDVCNSAGLWFTCSVKEVTDSEISVEFPWWSSKYVIESSCTKTLSYPSVYIAPAGHQAFDWRSRLQLGSYFRYRLDDVTLYVKIVMATETEFIVMHYVDSELFVLPRELRDTTLQQFGPEFENYVVNKEAVMAFSRFEYTDCTTSIRVTFDIDGRYTLPKVQLTHNDIDKHIRC